MPAQPQWGWSGVVPRRVVGALATKLEEVVHLLPDRRTPDEQIIGELNDFSVRFLSDLVQDEYGPTRAERASALEELIGSIDQVVLALADLNDVDSRKLSALLRNLPEAFDKPILDRFDEFEAEKRALESIALAAAELNERSPSPGDRIGLGGVKRLLAASERAARLVLALDTTSDCNLVFGSAPRITEVSGRDDDLARRVDAIRRLLSRLRSEFDRLSLVKGPDTRVSLPILVAGLCNLWERETGQTVTVNPYRKTEYDGSPQSEAGAFVALAVAALAPTKLDLAALMEETGREAPPHLKSQLHWSPQAVHSAMRGYIEARRRKSVLGRQGS